MLFLTPNQQRQSTEGNSTEDMYIYDQWNKTRYFPSVLWHCLSSTARALCATDPQRFDSRTGVQRKNLDLATAVETQVVDIGISSGVGDDGNTSPSIFSRTRGHPYQFPDTTLWNIKKRGSELLCRCGGIYSYHFTASLLQSLAVKEFWKSVKIW